MMQNETKRHNVLPYARIWNDHDTNPWHDDKPGNIQNAGYDLVIETNAQKEKIAEDAHSRKYRQLKQRTLFSLMLSVPIYQIAFPKNYMQIHFLCCDKKGQSNGLQNKKQLG